jgi:hypothetical protein
MKRLFFVIMSLYLVSCATQLKKAPPPGAIFEKLQWETKAVVRDLKANKSHTLDIDILGDYPKNFRMEVSALMGVQVASLTLHDEEINYVLYHQKKFYQGIANESSFLPMMSMPLHPVNFMNIAYDTPLRGSNWSCSNGPDHKIAECNQSGRGVKVAWSERTPEGQKKVLISGPSFEMRWLFKPPQTEVQFKDDTFRLEAPAEFKTIQLK